MAAVSLVLAVVVAWPLAAHAETEAGDEALRQRIEARLAALPDEAGRQVRVAVREGQVVLQGRVSLLEHSLRAEQAAWTTPGVRDVDNELRVTPLEPGGDAAIERRIRLILEGDGRFMDTRLELSVAAGFVELRGTFEDPGDVLALKHRIASIPGVLDVRIDAILVARAHGSGSAS